MSRQTGEILKDALTHLQTIDAYGRRDLGDPLVVDAICMRLSAAIEVLATLDSAVRLQIFGDDWPLMWGMRNRIAHGYMLVDADIVRATIAQDVPKITEKIQEWLGADSGSDVERLIDRAKDLLKVEYEQLRQDIDTIMDQSL